MEATKSDTKSAFSPRMGRPAATDEGLWRLIEELQRLTRRDPWEICDYLDSAGWPSKHTRLPSRRNFLARWRWRMSNDAADRNHREATFCYGARARQLRARGTIFVQVLHLTRKGDASQEVTLVWEPISKAMLIRLRSYKGSQMPRFTEGFLVDTIRRKARVIELLVGHKIKQVVAMDGVRLSHHELESAIFGLNDLPNFDEAIAYLDETKVTRAPSIKIDLSNIRTKGLAGLIQTVANQYNASGITIVRFFRADFAPIHSPARYLSSHSDKSLSEAREMLRYRESTLAAEGLEDDGGPAGVDSHVFPQRANRTEPSSRL